MPTAPQVVSVFPYDSYDLGGGLPIITRSGVLISSQVTLDAVVVAAATLGVNLAFGPAPTAPVADFSLHTSAQTLTTGQKLQVKTNIDAGTLTTISHGSGPQSAYPFESGETRDGIVSDVSLARYSVTASRGLTSPSSFFGETAVRVEVADSASVVGATTAPYLYGVRVRVSPRYGRNQTAIDDIVGFMVSNRSFSDYGTAFNGTEAIYVGWGGGSTGGASKDWNAGIGIDTVADKGMYIVRGPYDYGILMTASFTTAALRIPNNSKIVARNAGDTANVDVLKLDTSSNVRLGSGAVRVVVGAPNADADPVQPFEVQAGGTTDGATLGRSHVRIIDTTAFAINNGGTITFGGYQDATPTIRSFGAITGRKANVTSGNSAGYLALYSRHATNGLTEVLRLTELQQVQVADAANFILGSTTGHQFGTAASQKLALWGKTPIIQPTTAFASATFVANAGTAINTLSTFDGYTIPQIVALIRALGAAA